MPVLIDWPQIALRLFFTVLAGLIIGFNRGERGRPAGLRTTLLVCLAASLAMLQANLLMHTVGKSSDSFVVLDLMRLPLGILCGMGFIGAGTILRRGNLIQGVTTAATLWFVTVLGLCFGGGQIALGLAATIIGWLILTVLKYVESFMRQDKRGTLILRFHPAAAPPDAQLQDQIRRSGSSVISWGIAVDQPSHHRQITCEIRWRARPDATLPPAIVQELLASPAVSALHWQPQDAPEDIPQQINPQGTPIPISRQP